MQGTAQQQLEKDTSKWHFPQFLADPNSGAVRGYQNHNSGQADIQVQVHFQALSFQRLSISPSHTNSGSSISAAHQHIYSIMTTCRATGSDPNDYFLIHLRILICSVMACLLRWVEEGVGNTEKKRLVDNMLSAGALFPSRWRPIGKRHQLYAWERTSQSLSGKSQTWKLHLIALRKM